MNVNRLIWVSTTILFCFIGFLLGLSLGRVYVEQIMPSGMNRATQNAVLVTLTVGGAIIFTRFGSWLADRFLLSTLSRMQQVSPADRVLGITGALLGLLFGVLVTLPLLGVANKLLAIPVQLCIMTLSAIFGMALLQGMRNDMIHVFPALQDEVAPSNPRCSAKILDTNIIIDGRMADICKTGFIEGTLFVPSFVLEEVQYIADSADSLKRARGRRGLDVLNNMRAMTVPDPNEPESEVPVVQVLSEFSPEVRKISTVDSKLVALAKELHASIVTNDFNLNKVAELQGVQVLNINELVHALRPVVLPGEEMNIMISREGKEAGQGVGYLDDGTMVVVGDGRRHIGETCKVTITSVIQTVAGKMIFAEMKEAKGSGDDLFSDDNGKRHGSGAPGQATGDDSGYRSGGGMRRKNRP